MKTKPRLDYLFEADFADGTTYIQGADDESLFHEKDAEGNGPSAYQDVQDRMDEVIRFHLVGKGNRYSVDLTDGHFEVNGVAFWIERPPLPLTNIELLFLRYTNIESKVESTMQKTGLWGKLKEVERAHYVDRYVIGFRALLGKVEVTYQIAVMGAK